MKKNILIVTFLVLFMNILMNDVKAGINIDFIITRTQDGASAVQYHLAENGDPVFCVDQGLKAPSSTSTCNVITYDKNLQAAFGYVLKEFEDKLDGQNQNSKDQKSLYFDTNQIIHILVEDTRPSDQQNKFNRVFTNKFWNCPTLLEEARNVYKAYGNEKLYLSDLTTLNLVDDYYISNEMTIIKENLNGASINKRLTIQYDGGGQVYELSSDYIKISGDKLRIQIPKSELEGKGTINLTVSISSSKTYQMAVIKSCGEGVQRVANYITESEKKDFSDSSSHRFNIDPCVGDLSNEENKGMLGRIKLYEKYHYNGLLDLSKGVPNSSTNVLNACKNYPKTYSNNASCLVGNFGNNNTFNQNNLSNFNEQIDVNGNQAFCLTTFTLENKLGKSVFSAFKGQMPIQYPDQTAVATGIVTKKCYVVGDNGLTDNKIGKYSDYVESINFENKPLTVKNNEDGTSGVDSKLEKDTKESSGNWHVYSKKIDYYLNPIYAIIGKGELKDTECANCRFLGYGIISKFNDKDSIEIPFSIKLKQKEEFKFDSINYENKCEARLTEQLIKDDKLDLEFRLIDTNNPFPGKSGAGRKVGSNWCSDTDCQNNNNLITEVILNKPNSYGKIPSTKETKNPMYNIKLTPNIINSVREYNEGKSYDDFTLKCDSDSKNCKSTFLEWLNNLSY